MKNLKDNLFQLIIYIISTETVCLKAERLRGFRAAYLIEKCFSNDRVNVYMKKFEAFRNMINLELKKCEFLFETHLLDLRTVLLRHHHQDCNRLAILCPPLDSLHVLCRVPELPSSIKSSESQL